MTEQSQTFGRSGQPRHEARPLVVAAGSGPPGWLKKVLMIAIPMVVVIAGIFVFLFHFLGQVRNELDTFLKPMFTRAIAAGWTEASLERYSTSELNAWFLKNDVDAAAAPWRALGPMLRYDGVSEFQVETEGSSGNAEALVGIEFEKGTREFNVTLRRIEGRWYLHAIRMNE